MTELLYLQREFCSSYLLLRTNYPKSRQCLSDPQDLGQLGVEGPLPRRCLSVPQCVVSPLSPSRPPSLSDSLINTHLPESCHTPWTLTVWQPQGHQISYMLAESSKSSRVHAPLGLGSEAGLASFAIYFRLKWSQSPPDFRGRRPSHESKHLGPYLIHHKSLREWLSTKANLSPRGKLVTSGDIFGYHMGGGGR